VRVARLDRAGEVGDDDGRLHPAQEWRVEACPPGNLRPCRGHRPHTSPVPGEGAVPDCSPRPFRLSRRFPGGRRVARRRVLVCPCDFTELFELEEAP
jgi:hypothetical protein